MDTHTQKERENLFKTIFNSYAIFYLTHLARNIFIYIFILCSYERTVLIFCNLMIWLIIINCFCMEFIDFYSNI